MRIKSIQPLAAILVGAIALNSAAAADLRDFSGTWIMRLGERNLFVLNLTASNGCMAGSLDHPAKFSSTNNLLFANMRGGIRRDKLVGCTFKNGALHFTTQNANDPEDEDSYVMTLDGSRAELSFDIPAGAVVEPFIVERAKVGAVVATDWQPNRVYTVGDSEVPSAEMKAIFDEDQHVRLTPHPDWPTVTRTDAERREQTRKLLAAGALHTGKDFEEAAFVFQHGDSPQDYLLAHTLAMVAVSKGDSTAIWIAAATLDRYLENIGQKQIFGTQFKRGAQQQWTQAPYDRDLISDSLRMQLGVPDQAMQAKQLEEYKTQP